MEDGKAIPASAPTTQVSLRTRDNSDMGGS
jgi:hypothetical protein